MQVHHDEGVANRIDLESCANTRGGSRQNRFLSALMSAIVFALVFETLVYFGYGSVSMSVTTTPSTAAPGQMQK